MTTVATDGFIMLADHRTTHNYNHRPVDQFCCLECGTKSSAYQDNATKILTAHDGPLGHFPKLKATFDGGKILAMGVAGRVLSNHRLQELGKLFDLHEYFKYHSKNIPDTLDYFNRVTLLMIAQVGPIRKTITASIRDQKYQFHIYEPGEIVSIGSGAKFIRGILAFADLSLTECFQIASLKDTGTSKTDYDSVEVDSDFKVVIKKDVPYTQTSAKLLQKFKAGVSFKEERDSH